MPGVGAWSRAGRVVVSVALALLVGSAAEPRAAAQYIMDELPEPARGLEITDRRGERVPVDLPFIDQDGRNVTVGDYFTGGRPVVVMMMYFNCPLLCPRMMDELVDTLNRIDYEVGKEYDVLMVSFDPRDTPTDASLYQQIALQSYNRPTTESMAGSWNFLVGEAHHAMAFAEAIGYAYRYLPESGEYSHPTVIFVLTPDGVVSRALSGLQFPPSDLRLALVEASEGRIGSVFDRFTLWCYTFDPQEGSYVLQAMRIMQFGGGLTAMGLIVLVGLLLYSERRRRASRGRRGGADSVDHPRGRPGGVQTGHAT